MLWAYAMARLAGGAIALAGVVLASGGSSDVPAGDEDRGRQHEITVIDGGCPLMFNPTADPGHKMMRLWCASTGNMPKQVLHPHHTRQPARGGLQRSQT